MCFGLVSQSSIAWRYFSFLLSERLTVCTARSHWKPMNGTVVLKGISFVFSHGFPNSLDRVSMSAMQ